MLISIYIENMTNNSHIYHSYGIYYSKYTSISYLSDKTYNFTVYLVVPTGNCWGCSQTLTVDDYDEDGCHSAQSRRMWPYNITMQESLDSLQSKRVVRRHLNTDVVQKIAGSREHEASLFGCIITTTEYPASVLI